MERRIFTEQELANIFRDTVISEGSSITDWSDGSDPATFAKAVAYIASYMQLEINKGFNNFRVPNARGVDLAARVQDYNIKKKEGVAATTPVKFIRNSAATSEFTIAADSQVSTEPDVFGNTIDFTTDSDITFPSGAMYVTGMVTCTQVGLVGNVPSGSITNMTSTIPGIDSITNPEASTDGAEEETDEELRRRIPIHIMGLKAGNLAAIQAKVLAIPGITIAKVVKNFPSLGQNTIYVSNQSGILTEAQKAEILEAAEGIVAFGINVNLVTPTVTYVTISMDLEYDSVYFDSAVLSEIIKTNLVNFVTTNQSDKLKIWDIMNLIDDIAGITNVTNVKIDGVASDKTVDGFSAIRLESKDSVTLNFTAQE